MTVALLLALVLVQPASGAKADLSDMPTGQAGTVTEVIDGDTVILDTGTEVRMVGIQAPKLPLGRQGFRAWPLADESRATLEALVRNRRFTPHYGGQPGDRHGRALAHLVSDDGTWLQGEMLRLGMARVYSFHDIPGWFPRIRAWTKQAGRGRCG